MQQPDFVQNVLQACKAQGIHTALDTCGYAEWASLERCRHFVDLFLYDIKIMDEKRHIEYTGVSNRLILQNLQRLSEHGHNITIRQPIIPDITDDGENILAIASFVSQLPQPHQIDLLPYHSIARDKYARLQTAYSFANMQPTAQDKLYQIKDHIQQFGINVNIGG